MYLFDCSFDSMWWYIILAFLAWGGIWYLVFYFQYEKKDVVAELRKNLKKANDQLLVLQDENDELTAQNNLFREKTTELLEKNDELSDVVAELGKYYVHLKKASEKTAELSKYLNEPDDDMEEKLEILAENEKNQVKNSFF